MANHPAPALLLSDEQTDVLTTWSRTRALPQRPGRGSFVCTPQAMIATDSSGARSLSYTGTAEYSIATGP